MYVTTIWYILWLFGIFCGYLVYFMVIWYILWLFDKCYVYLVYFMVIWYTLSRLGIFYQNKSGNTVPLSLPSLGVFGRLQLS
jgi:hypothetical protein